MDKPEGRTWSMSLVDRVLLTLYTMVVAVLSLSVIAAYAGYPPSWDTTSLAAVLTRWEVVPVAVVFLLFSIRVLLSGMRKERTGTTITHHSELGDVRITLTAIQNLAQRAAKGVRGVKEAKVSVQLVNDALVVNARVATSLDNTAPGISAALQEAIRENVQASTGVSVKEVKVLVEDMSPAQRVRVQ
jgi:uncharacterized alkaline shock family protein YloU